MEVPPAANACCAVHAAAAAVVSCRRCGTFCCPDCLEIPATDGLCVACAARPPPPAAWTHELGVAGILASFLGLGCAPLALAGVALAVWTLRRVRGKPWRERALPTAALVLGVVGLLVGAGVFVHLWLGAPEAD